jgi:hypothetical protein
VAPLSVLLDDGTPALARPAGVAPPAAPAAQARLVTRLGELLLPGARVYVEMAPKTESKAASERAPVPASAAPASLWLPPPDADETQPFPYEKARLVAAVLIQEGLAPVNLDEPYVYQNEFLLLEDDARRHGRGLWAAEATP